LLVGKISLFLFIITAVKFLWYRTLPQQIAQVTNCRPF